VELGGEVWGKWGVSAAVVVFGFKTRAKGGMSSKLKCGEDSRFQQFVVVNSSFQQVTLRIHIFTTMKQAAALLALATTAAANHDYTVSDLISGNFTVTTNDITMGT